MPTGKKSFASHLTAALAVSMLVLSVHGCGDDDEDGSQPTPTFTVAATATPTPPPEEHSEVLIGSDEAGGGRLKAEYEFDQPVHASFSACLGGTGEDCTGGISVYSVVSPGFDSLEEDEPEASHFTLADGAEITLTIIAVDPGLSFKLDSTVVDSAGEALVLGEPPFHADIETQVAVEDGAVREDGWRITFELTSSDPRYQPSEEYTLIYQLGDEHD